MKRAPSCNRPKDMRPEIVAGLQTHRGRLQKKSSRPSVALFASHAAGGVMEVMNSVADGLDERGYRCACCAFYPYENDGSSAPGWHAIVPARPKGVLARLKALRELARWLRRERPDVIVCAMQLANVLLPPMARLFSPRSRIVVTHHSPATANNRWLDRLDSLTGRMRNVGAILTVAPSITRSLAHKPAGYRRRQVEIPNALPAATEKLIATLAEERRTHPSGRVVVAAGRLVPVKNYPVLIRAARFLPDVDIRIVGDGPDREALESLIRQLGVTGRVRLMGRHDRAATMRLLAQGDVFVQMSFSEGHSLALIEAAKLGLPLIVSDIPPQRDAITLASGEPCGVTQPVDDDDALARTIRRLLDDEREMTKARDRSRRLGETLRFDRMIDRYETLIGSVCASRD